MSGTRPTPHDHDGDAVGPADRPSPSAASPAPADADLARFAQIQDAIGVVARRARDTQLLEALGARVGRPLEGPAYSTLSRLALAEECTVTQLAGLLGLELSTVSRRVRALEEQGLVARATDPADRRASRLRLTAEGRELFEAMSAAWRHVLVEVLDDWDPFSVEVFAELFTRFAGALEAYGPASATPSDAIDPAGPVPAR